MLSLINYNKSIIDNDKPFNSNIVHNNRIINNNINQHHIKQLIEQCINQIYFEQKKFEELNIKILFNNPLIIVPQSSIIFTIIKTKLRQICTLHKQHNKTILQQINKYKNYNDMKNQNNSSWLINWKYYNNNNKLNNNNNLQYNYIQQQILIYMIYQHHKYIIKVNQEIYKFWKFIYQFCQNKDLEINYLYKKLNQIVLNQLLEKEFYQNKWNPKQSLKIMSNYYKCKFIFCQKWGYKIRKQLTAYEQELKQKKISIKQQFNKNHEFLAKQLISHETVNNNNSHNNNNDNNNSHNNNNNNNKNHKNNSNNNHHHSDHQTANTLFEYNKNRLDQISRVEVVENEIINFYDHDNKIIQPQSYNDLINLHKSNNNNLNFKKQFKQGGICIAKFTTTFDNLEELKKTQQRFKNLTQEYLSIGQDQITKQSQKLMKKKSQKNENVQEFASKEKQLSRAQKNNKRKKKKKNVKNMEQHSQNKINPLKQLSMQKKKTQLQPKYKSPQIHSKSQQLNNISQQQRSLLLYLDQLIIDDKNRIQCNVDEHYLEQWSKRINQIRKGKIQTLPYYSNTRNHAHQKNNRLKSYKSKKKQ